MKLHIVIFSALTFWLGQVQALELEQPISLKVTTLYGEEYTKGDIVTQEQGDELLFEFTSAPAKNIYKKVIQIFTPLWKLKSGSYRLIIKAKTNGPSLKIPMALNGKSQGDEKIIKVIPIHQREITASWSEISMDFEVTQKIDMGHFSLRVGGVPEGAKIHLGNRLLFTSKP